MRQHFGMYYRVEDLVGRTPLMMLERYKEKKGLCGNVIAKLECFNPGGSAKDRVAATMICKAREEGKLKEGGTIIEPTSGHTGIGLAAIGGAMGYRVIIVMPDTMSLERQKLIAAYGAELVLTEGALGMAGAIAKAEELRDSIEGSIIAGQFDNPANSEAHYHTTGPEIWEDTKGKVDIFVAGVGTGGTVTGVGRYLKEQDPSIKVVAVEPYDSPLLSEGRSGAHGLQGIGANFVPSVLDTEIYDEIVTVKTEEAYEAARDMAKIEGLLVGISSGAALWCATRLAEKEENRGKNIVVLLPDTGERYLSTDLFG